MNCAFGIKSLLITCWHRWKPSRQLLIFRLCASKFSDSYKSWHTTAMNLCKIAQCNTLPLSKWQPDIEDMHWSQPTWFQVDLRQCLFGVTVDLLCSLANGVVSWFCNAVLNQQSHAVSKEMCKRLNVLDGYKAQIRLLEWKLKCSTSQNFKMIQRTAWLDFTCLLNLIFHTHL